MKNQGLDGYARAAGTGTGRKITYFRYGMDAEAQGARDQDINTELRFAVSNTPILPLSILSPLSISWTTLQVWGKKPNGCDKKPALGGKEDKGKKDGQRKEGAEQEQ